MSSISLIKSLNYKSISDLRQLYYYLKLDIKYYLNNSALFLYAYTFSKTFFI
jgi:hypothetical protein